MPRPRIVFMGTPPFAVEALRACLQVGEVVAVVTQPDKPKGRGQELATSAVKQVALEEELPVLQPARLRGTSFAEELRALRADVSVVAAYGRILPADVLEAPSLGSVNVHASLLPRFRGAAPIQWAIAEGDARTGVCLMRMDEGLDTGPILACAEHPIRPEDTSASLHDALAVLGAELLRRELPRYLAGELRPVPQPAEGVVLAPMIRKEDGLMDFRRPARQLERRLRAFTPWPGAYTFLEGRLFKVLELEVRGGRGEPGQVLGVGPEGIEVATGEGSLLLTRVQPEGKRPMAAWAFASGRKLEIGSSPFGHPPG